MDNKPKSNSNRSLGDALLPPSNTRMASNRIVGQGIGAEKIGDVITGSPASTNLGSGLSSGIVVIPNSESRTFVFTLSDRLNRVVMATIDTTIYIDSISVAGQWPNATYGMGNMPSAFFNDWGNSNNVNQVSKVTVRNNTGADRNVIVVARFRLITNSTPALSGLTQGSV